MKLLNDLKLQFEKELWALNPELAVIDTILTSHPEIVGMVKQDLTGGKKGSILGRKDMPTVEQIVRSAIYKEIKNLTYRELEYQQHDSRLCAVFIKLDDRKPFSFKMFQKHIKKLKDSGVEIKVRSYKKQAKKNHFKINNTKAKDKQKEEFKKQLKLLRSSINQAERALMLPLPNTIRGVAESEGDHERA